jgi:release factor glutamine methyltransferase
MACEITIAKQLLKEALINHYENRELANVVRYYFEDKFAGKKFLTDAEENIFFEDIEKLRHHRPLQHVVGKAYFYDRFFLVNSSTLIPRPETEELVRLVINKLNSQKNVRILEVGTGSGCIPIILNKVGGYKNITAIDIDEGALEIARQNSLNYNCDVKFLKVDFLDENEWAQFDDINCIVSNPPYISHDEKSEMASHVIDYEPHTALFAEEPLVFYKAISRFSDKNPKLNRVFLELNPIYASETKELFRKSFKEVEIVKDMQGKERMLYAVR